MTTTTSAYLAISNNLAARLKTTAAEPQVKSDTAYFLANIGKVKTIADFVGNYRLFSYAMKAYGLGDQSYAKGLMTKVLAGGVTSASALANTLNDPRIKAFATAFDFAGQGAGVVASAAATTGTAAKYAQQQLDDDAGKLNPGVQLALYFTQNASAVTSLYGLLADKTMLKVVQTAFGLPTSTSADIDSLKNTLSKYVSTADLQNPAKVKQIAERFTAQYDASGQNGSSDVATVSQLFAAPSTGSGFSSDLLLSIQELKLGGS